MNSNSQNINTQNSGLHSSSSNFILAYNELISSKKIKADPAQQEIIFLLDNLKAELEKKSVKKGVLGKLKNIFKENEITKGLYVWGGVGRGKSMMMDLFYKNLNVDKKLRTHFHQFMIDVHNRIKVWRDANPDSGEDVIHIVAEDISKKAKLLCFDEMQVKDIADAMIIGRLFEKLFENGVTVIATSNVAPDDLYKNGLQRDRFLPFIAVFKENMNVHKIKSETDYRLLHFKSLERTYFSPLGKEADKFVEHVLDELNITLDEEEIIEVKGRKIIAKNTHQDVAMFEFEELCAIALGAEDYIEIAKRFSTLIIKNIPQMNREKRNEALRFINLIDALYEAKTKLICTAEVNANELYVEGDNSFEFQRTASRLFEMQSEEYINTERN